MRASPESAGAFVEGYAEQLSYAPGETATIACRTSTTTLSAEIARVGAAREIVFAESGIAGRWCEAPVDAAAAGCDWPVTFSYKIPQDARSGYYEVVLRSDDERDGSHAEGYCFFAVRRAAGRAAEPRSMLLVLSTNTYNAYNDWGGLNLYNGGTVVSFLRPLAPGFLRKPEPHTRYPNVIEMDDPEHEHFRNWADMNGLARWSGSSGWHNWERVFVRWAESQGYRVGVAVSSDLERHPEVLKNERLFVSVGHDEYWSWKMRDTVEAFVAGGGNAAIFSGNTVCWQVRYEGGGSQMVCYKSSYEKDPVFATKDKHLTSTMWCSALVGRPENALTGLSFSRGGYVKMGRAVARASGGYTAWRPDHWVFEGTGLGYGDLFGARDNVVSYEVDGCEMALSLDDGLPLPTGRDGTPADLTILASAPARLWSRDELPSRYRSGEPGDLEAAAAAVFGDASPEHVARLAHNHCVMGVHQPGGTVFNAGSTDWAYGLAGHDPDIEQITRNVLSRLTA